MLSANALSSRSGAERIRTTSLSGPPRSLDEQVAHVTGVNDSPDEPASSDREPRPHEFALAAAGREVLRDPVVRLRLRHTLDLRHTQDLPPRTLYAERGDRRRRESKASARRLSGLERFRSDAGPAPLGTGEGLSRATDPGK